MTIRDDLRTYLLADTSIATLLGTRVYPDVLQQGCTLPAAATYVISQVHGLSLDGIVAAGDCRIQIDVSAETRLVADQVTTAIAARLTTLSAACPVTIGTATKVADVELSGPRDDQQGPSDGSDDWTYISSIDVLLTIG